MELRIKNKPKTPTRLNTTDVLSQCGRQDTTASKVTYFQNDVN